MEVHELWFSQESVSINLLEKTEKLIFGKTPLFDVTWLDHRDSKRNVEILGFTPNVKCNFRLLSGGKKHGLAIQSIKQSCFHWITQADDYFALLFNNEQVMISHCEEGFIIDPRWFTEDELKNLSFEYIKREILL